MSKKGVISILAALIAIGFVRGALADNQPDRQTECRKFVQSFYDWYLAKSNSDGKLSPCELALQKKAEDFSGELTAQLKGDLKASAQNPGEVVGLDFDPFLNAQDTPSRYDAGKVTSINHNYLVDVYGTWNGKKAAKPDVVPELACINGKFRFVNFHYENDKKASDLLTVLRQLREERKPSRK